MKRHFSPDKNVRNGFTLVELLAVITIIAIIATFAAPSLQGVLMGSNLNRTGQLVGDEITLALQVAVTRNRDVEVRFIQTPNATGTLEWRAMQVFASSDDGTTMNPIGKLSTFPEGIILSPEANLSPLRTADTTVTGKIKVGSASRDYTGFKIRASGSLNSDINSSIPNNFLTLQSANLKASSGGAPSNFYTLQVNPITGKVSIYRP